MVDFVRSLARTVGANFTRPNNTTQYAAGQVVSDGVGTILKFPNVTKDNGGQAILMQVTLVDEANQTTKPDLQLFLFDTSPTSVVDQGNVGFVNADMRTLVGVVALPVGLFVVANAAAGASGNCLCDAQSLWLPINTVTGDNALYGVLVVRNAYTPVANERFDVRLHVFD